MVKAEIHSLTSLRGIAALWVATTHLSMGIVNGYLPGFSEKTDFGIFTLMIGHGHYAVDFFFILSGFIMCYAYKEKLTTNYSRQNLYNFYVARIARLWPITSFFSILLFILLITGLWTSERNIGVLNFILSILFLDLTLGTDAAINQPAWSISAEFFAYLLFPFFLLFLKKDIKLNYLIMAVLGLSGLYIFTQALYGPLWYTSSLFILFRVSIGFLCGCLLYSISQKTDVSTYADKMFLIFLAAFAFFIIFLPLNYFVFPLIPWLVLFLAFTRKSVNTFMSLGFMTYLGKISFSIYLVHYPFIELMEAFCGDYFATLDRENDQFLIRLYLIGMISGVTGLAALCYHCIEMPGRMLIKKKFTVAGSD